MILNYHIIFTFSKSTFQIEFGFHIFQITALIILIDFMNEDTLQENSIIYLSAGFDGPFVLQAFSVRKLTLPAVGLQMCLTDGKVYIGAKYNSSDYPEVQDYWLLEITAKFVSQSQPIIIKTMQVVSTYPRKLLGSPPCTLLDYFNKQTNKSGQQKMGEPVKKIKYSNFDLPLLKNSDTKKPAQKQKQSAQFHTIPPNLYKKKQESKAKPESDKKTNQKKLKIADSEEEDQANNKVKKQTVLSSSHKKERVQSIDDDSEEVMKNTLISELYQRRTGWIILCRINYLNRVECNNGLTANNFMLVDQVGQEIKCVYFENPLDNESDKFETDKYYSFSDGEISRGNKNDGSKELQITFDKNSTIIPRSNIEFSMNIARFCRIVNIPNKEANSEVNVIGVIKIVKFIDQSNKNKLRYSATICDPLSGYQIDLLLFLNSHEKPPQKGSIGYLHNYQLFKQNNICRLNSTYKSYFREQKSFKDQLTQQLKKVKEDKDWESICYKNLSSVPFSFRTIKDLKRIINSTDDEKIYSLIDCWVLELGKKKFYHACKVCKKGTDKKDSGVFYCPNCKKNVDTFHCHTLTANFADFTSNLSVDVIGEHAETLLELKSVQFFQLPADRQLMHLDSLKCKNVTLKLKTEKRDNKRETHSVWAIEQSNSLSSLKQIRKRLEQSKVKIDEKW